MQASALGPEGKRTTTGGVETGLLAQESRVLHCIAMSAAVFRIAMSRKRAAKELDTVWIVGHIVFVSEASNCTVPLLFASLARGRWGGRTLRAEELAGDVQCLTSHDDDLLAVEQLLGDSAGEATEQVPLAVDDLEVESASGSMGYWAASRKRETAPPCGERLPCTVNWSRAVGAYVR